MGSPKPATTFESIEVEAVGEDEFVSKVLYRGDEDDQLRTAYGGQLLGQALMSACHTVRNADLLLLSAHCYFMSPVSLHSPVNYRVTRTKDGRVFSTRAIQVLQEGKVVSHCLASFKRSESNPPVLSHSPRGIPPGIYPPDDPRLDQRARQILSFNHRPGMSSFPFDSYHVFSYEDQQRLLAKEPLQPRVMSWLRCSGETSVGKSQNIHRAALAFLSDFSMLYSIRLKYPEVDFGITTSLDHSVWFHSPVNCDLTWFLQAVRCIQASEGTSLNSSHMYSEDGTLVATCQQQALFRHKAKL